MFVTGPAGTGKSTVLKELRKVLRGRMDVVASTGIAAVNVGGMTLHSWLGIGLGEGSAALLAHSVKRNRPEARDRIQGCKTLCIDEVSMCSGHFLDKVEEVLRRVRGSQEPFGGIQVIMWGDFLQLPPVGKRERPPFAFESTAWANARVEFRELKKMHRQGEDLEFAEALNDIRMGQITQKVSDLLNSRYLKDDLDLDKEPIVIHTHNADVDQINRKRLAEIDAESGS